MKHDLTVPVLVILFALSTAITAMTFFNIGVSEGRKAGYLREADYKERVASCESQLKIAISNTDSCIAALTLNLKEIR